MCWSRRDWRKQVKQKEKRKKKLRKNKVTKEIISPSTVKDKLPSFALYVVFFSSSWTLLRPCAFTKRTIRGNSSLYVSPCEMSKTLKMKREPILLCTDDPVSDTSIKCPDAKPNQDQCGRASNERLRPKNVCIIYAVGSLLVS